MTGLETPVVQGFFWSWVLPAIVLAVAVVATWLLYRRFSD